MHQRLAALVIFSVRCCFSAVLYEQIRVTTESWDVGEFEVILTGMTWIDFEKGLLHGPISINIPDNKATKYSQTR